MMIRTARKRPTSALRAGLVTALLAAPLVFVPPGVTAEAAPPTELFMSEYIEGSSFNKAVEIFNGTGAAVDLGAGAYTMELYSNGSPTPSETLALSGTVADGDVFVLSHGSANAAIQAQTDLTSSSVINFNGDDGVVLRKSGVIVDAFGQNDFDPGSQWPGGGQNDTLRRKATVCAGDTNFSDAFDAATEWDVFAQDDITDLGAHSVACGAGGPNDPVINEFVANHTGSDTQAFVEVLGDASTDYSAYTVLEIEGEGSTAGTIDAVLPVGTTNGSGYWIDDEDMENGRSPFCSSRTSPGARAPISTPTTTAHSTRLRGPGSSTTLPPPTADWLDITYSTTVLGPFFDGNPFGAGGASRIPDGTDTDTTADWMRNDFDGFGLPGFPGSPAIGEAENTPDAVNVLITVETDPIGVCNDPATFIHDIQGPGLASPDVGNVREIEGIVTGDFQAGNQLSGFFMQEETADYDGDVTTSEGIFVFNAGTGDPVGVGDTVRVRGSVTEFFGLTEINNVASVDECPPTGTTSPSSWTLPVSDVLDWEWVEGMEVSITQTLYASGNFTQARFGEVDLSIDGALDNPTNVVAPGAPAIALQDLNDRSRIQLDDGSTVQNPLPLPPYLNVDNTLRTGDTLPGIRGNVNYSFNSYQIEPTAAVDFTRVNDRPATPDVGGSMTVAAYNVLNYFTTIDGNGNICGPDGDQGCRGADSQFELDRQRAKIVSALAELDADVVGLIEIENPRDERYDRRGSRRPGERADRSELRRGRRHV